MFNKLADKAIFCGICGKRTYEKVKFDHYDSETGEKIYHTYVRCPLWWSNHHNLEYDEDGDYVSNSW